MQLLFVNRYAYPDSSATAQMLMELAEDLERRGATVTILAGRASYRSPNVQLSPQERYKGITIRRVQGSHFGRRRLLGRALDYASFYLLAAWTVLRLPRQDCLIVMSDPPLLSILGAVAGLVKQCKVICWLQDVFPDIAVRAGVLPDGTLTTLLRRLGHWSLGRMDMTVVLGRCMKQYLLDGGLPALKMVCVPNWANGSQIYPLGEEADNEFSETHGIRGKFVVMYSGNLGVVHDVETILSMVRFTAAFEGVVFCFVGDGVGRRQIEDSVCHEGWRHVLFLPHQPKEGLQWSLTAADVHLVTLREDMTGLSVPSKIYGVLAAGRPAIFIGPETCEVAWLINEAGCGYIVQPGDTRGAERTLRRCMDDRQELERRGLAGRGYFDLCCDRSVAVERFWHVLNEVCA